MNRREFVRNFALAGAAVSLPRWLTAAAPATATAIEKPNIVLILADDLGLDGLSCTGGNRCQTPNIDALAATGTRFEYCYATPLCGPSRSQLLTGRYPFRTGMTGNDTGDVMKPANEIMLPRVLKPAGYVTGQVGKWQQLPLQPSDWGFDEYLRFQGSGKYWATQDASYIVNGQHTPLGDKYMPDVMHDFAADFITRHKDRPFFLYYAMSEVHGPILHTPDSKEGDPARRKNFSETLYVDNLKYMDKLVGKLVAHIDKLGIREKTLIIFVADNGTAPQAAPSGLVDGKKLDGHKKTMLEGGSRVPMIVNWKGTTPAGKVCHDLTDLSDFMPTLAEIASAELPKKVTIDGQSFAPQIKGEQGTPREWVYVELNGRRYVRDPNWKLTGTGVLSDMSNAPFAEKVIPADTNEGAAVLARKDLQGILDRLIPAKLRVPSTKPSDDTVGE